MMLFCRCVSVGLIGSIRRPDPRLISILDILVVILGGLFVCRAYPLLVSFSSRSEINGAVVVVGVARALREFRFVCEAETRGLHNSFF